MREKRLYSHLYNSIFYFNNNFASIYESTKLMLTPWTYSIIDFFFIRLFDMHV